jgi:hypothetical protein
MTNSLSAIAQIEAALSSKSQWTASAVAAFLLETRIPLRLSTTNSGGYPQITSLWFALREQRLWCCTQGNSVVSRHIQRDGRAGFEVAVNDPPYYGISGYGHARIVDGDATELLTQLVDAQLGERDPKLKAWLLSRVASEAIVEITPVHITSWDFRKRMSAG